MKYLSRFFMVILTAIAVITLVGAQTANATAQRLVDAAVADMQTTLATRSSYVDLTTYNIPLDELDYLIENLYFAEPSAFYVDILAHPITTVYGVEIIREIEFRYTLSDAQIAECEAEADRIAGMVDRSWSQEQQALFVHDYIIANTNYAYEVYYYDDYSNAPHAHNAYGCLIQHTSVCDGFSQAYQLIMSKLGIECVCVASYDMGHGWNQVKIDGQWYNVDLTYDNLPWYGCADHKYFLKSDSQFSSLGHYSGYSKNSCTSTKYDSTWWDDIRTVITVYNGKYYYLGKLEITGIGYKLLERDGNNVTVLVDGIIWYQSETNYVTDTLLSMSSYDGHIFYTTSTNIYEYDIDTGTNTVIYTAPSGSDISGAVVASNRMAFISFRIDERTTTYITYSLPSCGYRTGWQQLDGHWYYFKSSGYRATGWQQISGKWYYFDSEGAMKTDWQQISGKWYYFSAGGVMQTGWKSISGKWYYFSDGGVMQTGWKTIDGKWYYFSPGGVMATGWQNISGNYYYFGTSGSMKTDWQQINGKWYYFGSSGIMKTYWQQVNGKWYYFGSSGIMKTLWQQIDGKWYYFNSNGTMQTGWVSISGKWYYFSAGGVMQTGWRNIDGEYYYFSSNGVMAADTWIGEYYIRPSGIWDTSR